MKAGATASAASLAEAYLDAVSQGEGMAAAERYFHPDIVYIVNRPRVPVDGLAPRSLSGELHSGLPWLGIYRGLDEVRAFLTHMHANLDVTGFGPRFDVALAFRGRGSWAIQTDGTTKTVPAER